MKSLLNILCYALGLMWLLIGLVGVYDPNIFAKNDIVSLNVVIQSEAGASEIRALAGMFSFMGLGILLAAHQPELRKNWFSVFSLLMLGLAIFAWEKLNLVHVVFLIIWLSHYVHRTFIWPFYT